MCGRGHCRKEIVMSDSTFLLPARPSLEQLRKQAKELLRAYRVGDTNATERFRARIPRLADPVPPDVVILADAQFVLAREYGFETWAELVHFVAAYQGAGEALDRLNDVFSRSLTLDQLREMIHQRMDALSGETAEFALADAELFVARQHGFESWERLVESVAQPPSAPPSTPLGLSSTPPFYRIDWEENTIEPRPPMSGKDWETIFDVMKELRITGLKANGQMTDEAMEGLTRLDHVTYLDLGGSKRLTDEGLKRLARMPQLEELDLSEYPGGRITDRGLEALRHLPELRRFQMCWQKGVSDAGVANLAFCD